MTRHFAFALDGMTGRGLVEVNSNQALLGRLNFILDIYRALDVLAKHPRVDPSVSCSWGFRAADRPHFTQASSGFSRCGTAQA